MTRIFRKCILARLLLVEVSNSSIQRYIACVGAKRSILCHSLFLSQHNILFVQFDEVRECDINILITIG